MKLLNSFKKQVFNIDIEEFDNLALRVFGFQAKNNKVYNSYITQLGIEIESIDAIDKIPFMPIDFFKHHDVKTQEWKEDCIFLSSGTTSSKRSHHLVQDLTYYLQHSKRLFENEIGLLNEAAVFALLPSYQEQEHSSLIAMVDYLMLDTSKSGYFIKDYDQLIERIVQCLDRRIEIHLFGVGYALLDFADSVNQKINFKHLNIIETGGMKGRREEITKNEFYKTLKKNLGEVNIFSEYGMTELLSQAYSKEDGLYVCPPQMKVLIRDVYDPFLQPVYNKAGGINVVDLANIHSCSFIETQDLGKVHENGQFEVLGRIDNSDVRGCNLLIE